jgi:hypothetical protein
LSLGRYALIVLGVVCGSLALSLPLLRLDRRAGLAAILGGALAAVNTVAAYGLVLWSERRSHVTFFRAVLGGTLGRMLALLGAVVAAILLLELPRLPLVVSLLSYFVLFLALELLMVHRRVGAQAPR